jgi:phenylacetate-CoA ligase
MIEPIQGKFEDIIYNSHGDKISPSIITFAFKGLQNIKKSQVAQVSKTEWEIRIVPNSNYSNAETTKLIYNIKSLIDQNIDIRVVIVDDIAKMDSGKFKWVVNEHPQQVNHH